MGLGIVVVEICDSNLMRAMELEDLEQEYPEVAVLYTECLNLCGLCKIRPYAMVNGKRVFGSTPEECVTLIKQSIAEELAAYNI